MGNFTVCLTHDVDRIRKTYQYISKDLRKLKIGNLKTIFSSDNPYWCFDKIMKIEDRYNVRSTFFFLQESLPLRNFSCENLKKSLGKYKFSDKKISNIIKNLDDNGWEIGLHGSYNSYKNLDLLRQEKYSLENILGRPVKGIRQHHLNLEIPQTWILQRQAGFEYDSSYGLKNEIGFPDSKYKPFIDDRSNMKVIPLTIMDGYLFSNFNNFDSRWQKCLEIINETERNNAVLSVLWHQRVFYEFDFPGYKKIYEMIIKECKKRNADFLKCKNLI